MRAAAILASVALGCAGDLENAERFADCAPGDVEEMFRTECGGTCHGPAKPAAGLDLESPGAAARVIGHVSQSDVCEGRMVIDPASDQHLLLDKLSDKPSCGARMPFGSTGLSQEQIECVRRWVEDALAAEGGS